MPTITPIMTIIITMIMATITITKANICATASANAGMIIPKAE
jgi:hypothetical protein